MSSANNYEVISKVSPHTIKKFELIEAYVEAWAHKLLEYGRNTGNCDKIVFIDCMSNSGLYIDENGEQVQGTPLRVAKVLSSIMRAPQYLNQEAWLYFNDMAEEKVTELKKHLPASTENFHVCTSIGDGNTLLKNLGMRLSQEKKTNYLLVYDPYTASIDWEAMIPFLRNWGEVIINHMVSDSIRAVPQAKRSATITKYEQTYLTSISELVTFGSDRTAYEQRVEEIINELRGENRRRYYIASYPFFNTRNALVYDLIHCTGSIEGFKLYKSTAWKTFGNKSSTRSKNTNAVQLTLALDARPDEAMVTMPTDENCYFVHDIVKFIVKKFHGRRNVFLKEIWDTVDEHPIFPSDLFKNEIKEQIKALGYKVHRSTIDFVS